MSDSSNPSVGAGTQISVANEYVGALVQKVLTAQGERLEILIPRTGARAHLDPMQLEAITLLPPEVFSEFIKRFLDDHQPHSH